MSYVLGIDVSTTATKALLVDGDGNVVSEGVSSYRFEAPHPTWAEQDPKLWWEAAGLAVRSALASGAITGEAVDAVGLTGQMHGSVLLDTAGEVVRPAILWNDQRTIEECDQIRHKVSRNRLIAITGNDALTGFTAPKLRWVANHEPDNWARVATLMLPKDYVRFRLTGERAVDVADGSGTILFELAARTWSSDVLEALDIDPAICPPVYEGSEITGWVSTDAAATTGLRPGTPVVAGGGDQAANAVGLGAVEPGIFALSLGTSGVVFATSDGVAIEPEGRLHAFCHAVGDKWHMMGVMLSAAGSLRWLRDALAPGVSFEELVVGAAQVPPGSNGLLFLPYLSGERTPHPDPLARGAFVGLTSSHDLRHLTRAVLEGVAFGLRENFDLMTDSGLAAPDSVRASGGGVRSRLWMQVLADVLGTEISKVATDEGAAYGAAMLAAVGASHFDDVEDAAKRLVGVTESVGPSGDVSEYAEAHARYLDLYPALRPTFHHRGHQSSGQS